MTDYEPADDDGEDPIEREVQPDDFCECRPGVEMRHGWQHARTCLRWSPPLRGPGSTPEGRAAALADIRQQLIARRREAAKP
jgi:hypothetical protein